LRILAPRRGDGGSVKIIDREWKSKAPRLGHSPAFDAIRGIGIFGVMIGHSFPLDTLSFAVIVDIFFVISGFLITSLLLQEHRNTEHISLRKFYARRSLRLMPLLYVLLVVVGVAAVVAKLTIGLDPPYFLSDLAKETVAAGFYVHNIAYPTLGGAWYGHLWTLSVEEQFYLVVGVVMMVVLVRGGIRAITVALIAFIAAIQISRGFAITGPFHQLAFAVWLQRPDSLMIGVLGAIINAHLKDPLSKRTRQVLKIGAYVGVVGIFFAVWASTSFARNQLGLHIPFWPGDQNYLPPNTDPTPIVQQLVNQPGWRLHFDQTYWMQWGFTLGNWSFLFVTLAAFRVKDWLPNRIISRKYLILVGGLLSYGLYLWHYPVQHFLRMFTGTVSTGRVGDHYRTPLNPVVQMFLDCALPFLLAVPTYFLVEKKALALKNRFRVERTTTAQDMVTPTVSPTVVADAASGDGNGKVAGNGSGNGSSAPEPEPPPTPARGSPGAS
jgi:peptidoglycan/LPS O-acetylase OafA/YrhL